jgi:hypothetical protein
MSAYSVLGLILIAIVVIAILIAAVEKGPCQPLDYKDYKKRWRK